MATYTGQSITWQQAMNSQEDLSPPKYEWGPLPEPKVAVPGVTPWAHPSATFHLEVATDAAFNGIFLAADMPGNTLSRAVPGSGA